jgi:hypothetical protein
MPANAKQIARSKIGVLMASLLPLAIFASSLVLLPVTAQAEGETGIDSCVSVRADIKYIGKDPVCAETLRCQEWLSGVRLARFQATESAVCKPLPGVCPGTEPCFCQGPMACISDDSVKTYEMPYITDEPSNYSRSSLTPQSVPGPAGGAGSGAPCTNDAGGYDPDVNLQEVGRGTQRRGVGR